MGGVRARRAGRPAGRGDPRRQQRARPRDRPARGQADARRAARARAHARRSTRRWSTSPTFGAAAVVARLDALGPWVLLPLAHAAARGRASCGTVRTHTDGPTLNEALAGTGMLQLAFCVLLPRASSRADGPTRVERHRRASATLRFRDAAARPRSASSRERELLELRLDGGDGVAGRGEAAPLEPYDGVPPRVAERARGLPRRCSSERATRSAGRECSTPAARSPTCPQALAAVDMALWDRAGRREGRPVAALLTDEPAGRGAGQRDDRRGGPRGRRGGGGRGRARRVLAA